MSFAASVIFARCRLSCPANRKGCRFHPASYGKDGLTSRFFYLAVVVDKPKLHNPAFQKKESLIKYASGLVFENAKPHLKDAIVVIDANGSKDFRNQLSKYLKKRVKDDVGYRVVKKVKTARSHGNNLVQLADMISGAVWRSFKQQDGSYRGLVSARELRVQVWPKSA